MEKDYITQEQLQKRWDNAWVKYVKSGVHDINDQLMFTALYVNMWGIAPHIYTMYEHSSYRKLRRLDVGSDVKYVDGSEKDEDKWDSLIFEKTAENIIKMLEENNIPYITQHYERTVVLVTARREMFFRFGTMTVISDYEYYKH